MRRKSPGNLGDSIMRSLDQVLECLDKGQRLEDRFVVRTLLTSVEPRRFGRRDIRALRDRLRMSQAVLARLMAVSVRTVQAWERGASRPSPMACRLLEDIADDPKRWMERLYAPKRKRRAG